MRIAICDDDEHIVEELHERIERLTETWSVNANIFDFTDGEDLLYEIGITGIFDIIFLDIEIGTINGIDIASKLNEKQYVFTLIFISQYDVYYRAAFEVQPFWFLDKPFSDEKLKKALTAALDKIVCVYDTYDYKYNKQYYRIMLDKIMYFESQKRVILIHRIDNEISKCYNKLNDIEEEISREHNRKFIRIHRSFYVNQMYVKCWSYDNIVMINGEVLEISKKYRENVRSVYLKIMSQRINEI